MLSSSQPSCSAPSAGPCPGSTSSSSNNSTCTVFAKLPGWQDCVSNTCVLEMCGISGIEAFVVQSQFRLVGHIVRMPDFRIPKEAFFGQLASGSRLQGSPVRRYKDSLKINLRACDLAPSMLRTAPLTGASGDSAAQMPYRLSRRGAQQLLSPNERPGRTLLLQEGR